MWQRLLVPTFLSLVLFGCATDETQIDICREVFTTLVGKIEIAPPESGGEGVVVLHGKDPASAHLLTCRFDDAPFGRRHLELMEVALDHVALSPIRMVMMRHLLGLAMPAALIEQPIPPIPLDKQAAYLVQQLINGLSVGAILALIATGYSLVYGITGTIQFAYGEIFMIGAFLFIIPFLGLLALGIGNTVLALALALPCAMAGTSVYGWVLGRVIYRPMYKANRLNALVAAVGLVITLREYVRLTQGARYKWMPAVLSQRFELFSASGFSVYLAQRQVVILALATALALGLAYLLIRTRWGRSYRACADDSVMAALLGIDIHATIGGTLVLGAALAALAGACFAIQYGEADAYMGFSIGMKALTAMVLGGFGTVTGALAGGLAVGVFEALWAGYFGSAYQDVAIFSLLTTVLVFRPEGLLGLSVASAASAQPTSRSRP